MSLISDGVERVRAFEVPGGIGADGSCDGSVRLVLVRWRSDHLDEQHQVYVNGAFAGVTSDCRQRRMLCRIPSSYGSAVRIEVFAVSVGQADEDLGAEVVSTAADDGRVRIGLLRSQRLPIDARADVYFDNGSGVIDYSEALNAESLWIWPSVFDKSGFGMSCFGEGDFAYDGSGAVGFGKGSFGIDLCGFDGDSVEWVSDQLPIGKYKFGVIISDSKGNASSATETGEVFVGSAAWGAEDLDLDSFERIANKLDLSISTS